MIIMISRSTIQISIYGVLRSRQFSVLTRLLNIGVIPFRSCAWILFRDRNILQSHGTSLLHLLRPIDNLLAMSQDSVSACIASLSSTYHDGVELLQQIKTKRKSRNTFQDASIDASAQELESSLNSGESAVRTQYERTHKRCGDTFAQGDGMFLPQVTNMANDRSKVTLQSWPGMLCKISSLTSKNKSLRFSKRNGTKTHSSTLLPCKTYATRAKIGPFSFSCSFNSVPSP